MGRQTPGGWMKKRKSAAKFFDQLKNVTKELRQMKPGDVHILSVNANYGNYQIIIGPEGGKEHRRDLKIDGEVHHLFISTNDIIPHPTREQVLRNLKNMVIMRKLHVHFHDLNGDGEHVMDDDGIFAQEYINLAGDAGKQLVMKAVRDRRISLAAYKIVQQDILKALAKKSEKRN
jgi:hypothetical protein